MTDLVLDTKEITINIVSDTDIEIINLVYPPYVQVNQPATIEYDVKNNGSLTSCFTSVEHNETEDHRWDGNIAMGGTQHVSVDVIPTDTSPLQLTIKAGYTYA